MAVGGEGGVGINTTPLTPHPSLIPDIHYWLTSITHWPEEVLDPSFVFVNSVVLERWPMRLWNHIFSVLHSKEKHPLSHYYNVIGQMWTEKELFLMQVSFVRWLWQQDKRDLYSAYITCPQGALHTLMYAPHFFSLAFLCAFPDFSHFPHYLNAWNRLECKWRWIVWIRIHTDGSQNCCFYNNTIFWMDDIEVIQCEVV